MKEEAKNVLSGAGAGFVAALIVCPLDVTKLRIQNQPQYSKGAYQGTRSTLLRILREEGVLGLYSGWSPTVVCYLIDRGIWFSTYERFKWSLSQWTNVPSTNPGIQAMSVALASFASNIMTSPFWVIRTRMMTQTVNTRYHYHSIYDGFISIIRKEGFLALYKGFVPSTIGIIHPIIQFPLYERLKLEFQGTSQEMNHLGILMASIISKTLAGILTYPHEVIRTRMQTFIHHEHASKRIGLTELIQEMIQKEKWSAFYRGLGTNMFRVVPSTALSLWLYEYLKKSL